MTNQLATVPFAGTVLETLKDSTGVAYVAMRPIVDGMGLSWGSQARKLANQHKKYGCTHMSTPSSGGPQQTLCIPLRKLNGWLFSINPVKVREDIRDRVIQYQEECFTVLFNYWNRGVVAPEPPKELSRMELIKLAYEAENERLRVEGENRFLVRQAKLNAPKLEFYEKVTKTAGSVSVNEAAKLLNLNPMRLFQYLRAKDWLTGKNVPMQSAINAGLMELSISSHNIDGPMTKSSKPMITSKGFEKLFLMIEGYS